MRGLRLHAGNGHAHWCASWLAMLRVLAIRKAACSLNLQWRRMSTGVHVHCAQALDRMRLSTALQHEMVPSSSMKQSCEPLGRCGVHLHKPHVCRSDQYPHGRQIVARTP